MREESEMTQFVCISSPNPQGINILVHLRFGENRDEKIVYGLPVTHSLSLSSYLCNTLVTITLEGTTRVWKVTLEATGQKYSSNLQQLTERLTESL